MNVISFIGIIVALAVFIALCFKGFNLFFNSIVCAVIIILTSGMAFLPTFKDVYMAGVGGAFKNLLMLFVLSCLYGKVMEDTGAVRSLALFLAKFTKRSKTNAKFLTACILPIFYLVLNYVGISGFVVVFTMVALARELFIECDIPWKYYCYGAAAGVPGAVLAGNAQAQNVNTANAFGTDISSGVLISIVYVVINMLALFAMIYLDVKKANKKQEGFLPSGQAIKEIQLGKVRTEKELPNVVLSALPLIATILSITLLKLDVLYALGIAIVLCFVTMYKYIESPKNTLANGIAASMTPVVNVAAASGIATIMAAVPGFQVIIDSLNLLPDMIAGVGLVSIVTVLVANPVALFGSESLSAIVVDKFSGLSAPTALRLTLGAQVLPCPPWNAGVINGVALTKIHYPTAALYYAKSAIPALIALGCIILLIQFGVFV